MTRYQLFLLLVLVAWPIAIMSGLFLMSWIERRLEVTEADAPAEAGLEPVTGESEDREVKIVFGDEVVGSE